MAQPETNAHLERAKQYIAKGDDFYAKAAQEIVAAKEERPELTWVEIGRQVGKSKDYVRRLAEAFKNRSPASEEPFVVNWEKGSNDPAGARRILHEAPIEQVERIVADLPPERRQAVAKAIEDTHPANQSKPPLGVPKADVTFLTRMAGPINRLRHAVDGFVVDYEEHVEDAHEDDVELVREEVAPLLAKVSALTTDWSVR